MHTQDKSILTSSDNETCFVLDLHAEPDFNLLAHEINSAQEDMPLNQDKLFWLLADKSLL